MVGEQMTSWVWKRLAAPTSTPRSSVPVPVRRGSHRRGRRRLIGELRRRSQQVPVTLTQEEAEFHGGAERRRAAEGRPHPLLLGVGVGYVDGGVVEFPASGGNGGLDVGEERAVAPGMLEAAGDLVDDGSGRGRPLQRVARPAAAMRGSAGMRPKSGDQAIRSAAPPSSNALTTSGAVSVMASASRGSGPAITRCSSTTSATVRPIGPEASFRAVAEAAVAGDAARGGEEADDAAERRRNPRRAAAVGTDRQRHHPGGDRGGGASARAPEMRVVSHGLTDSPADASSTSATPRIPACWSCR